MATRPTAPPTKCVKRKKLSPCFRREKKHVVRLISESLRHKNGFSITTWRRLELTNVRCILVENIVSLEFLKTESHWKIYCKTFNACTVVESHRKDLIQHCEWSKLRLHFECTKVHKKCKKNRRLASFWSLRSKSVTRQVSLILGQKLVENPKIQKLKCDILGIFKHFSRIS